MATIKALEGRTVHQIQSGQVIVDLSSVVKELVENSLDAGATSIEVRFKNHGLDSIEVQDNGSGISSQNYETIALKHCTSKLANYDDLSSLQTFGFRGEALSSLCALSHFYITTACAHEAPKGSRLDFEISGKLKSTTVIASQKGTTVFVEDIFRNLPVRRRELQKNIKREYGKALGTLQSYACISTKARISVSNMMAKGKKAIVFATRSNSTTRDNIVSIFGVKALPGLASMDLEFEMRPAKTHSQLSDPENKQVRVLGHVSKPSVGEGRQAADRQMFFVNARPCALPQVAKIFNEVYKSYNISQSPFIFANIILDTNAYDVNVSPDKRTILLHEQDTLLGSLRVSLMALFENQDQSVPISQGPKQRLPPYRQLTIDREASDMSERVVRSDITSPEPSKDEDCGISEDEIPIDVSGCGNSEPSRDAGAPSLIESFVGRDSIERVRDPVKAATINTGVTSLSKDKEKLVKRLGKEIGGQYQSDDPDEPICSTSTVGGPSLAVRDFNERLAEQQTATEALPAAIDDDGPAKDSSGEEAQIDAPTTSIIQNAFDHMRPRRNVPDIATITIGSKTIASTLGLRPSVRSQNIRLSYSPDTSKIDVEDGPKSKFSSSLMSFAAPGSQPTKTFQGPQKKDRSRDDDSQHPSSSPIAVSSDEAKAKDHGVGTQHVDNSEGDQRSSSAPDTDSDDDYIDDDEKKAVEEARVSELIKRAEESSANPSLDNKKRASQILKGAERKDATVNLIQVTDISIGKIEEQLNILYKALPPHSIRTLASAGAATFTDNISVEAVSLSVSKADFAAMHIIGQFNLGFILATRNNTDLFIIDQHASDEKYNFERLQATTTVQNQRLVHPRSLHLTAVEEEVVKQHDGALLKNGFLIDCDSDDDTTRGTRCKLISLPMSREVVFNENDLEELIALLADSSVSSSMDHVPRPSKVRRMFAMRACRSSIMVGKSLTLKQMEMLVRKMSEIDKPWNCPHGRPTMRHVCGLEEWTGWSERDGLTGLEEEPSGIDWRNWMTNINEDDDTEDRDGQDHNAGEVNREADELESSVDSEPDE